MCAELQIESLDASAVITSGSWYPHVVLGGINFWQISRHCKVIQFWVSHRNRGEHQSVL